MAGKYIGVQAQILKQIDSARFVPCAHSSNLIVDIASQMIQGLSNTIQGIGDGVIGPAIDYATKKAQQIGVNDSFAEKGRKITSKNAR
ncbi:hypothetical protein J6590_070871 [Homalodisca vitripennis]|nr:hypothetical protein J6590_070871 [Homalodisca vitripennis]